MRELHLQGVTPLAYIPPTTTCTSCGSILPLCRRPECGQPIAKNPHESAAKWGKRLYCSMECANAVRQIQIHGVWEAAVKPCLHCKKDCVQRRTESPSSFEHRKYCDRFCASAARRHGELSDRQQRVVRREERARRPKPKPKHPDAGRENKPLIRDVPVTKVEPAPNVWRPAAWQETDRRFA